MSILKTKEVIICLLFLIFLVYHGVIWQTTFLNTTPCTHHRRASMTSPKYWSFPLTDPKKQDVRMLFAASKLPGRCFWWLQKIKLKAVENVTLAVLCLWLWYSIIISVLWISQKESIERLLRWQISVFTYSYSMPSGATVWYLMDTIGSPKLGKEGVGVGSIQMVAIWNLAATFY